MELIFVGLAGEVHVDRRVYVRTTDARGVCLLVRARMYLNVRARACDKYRQIREDQPGKKTAEIFVDS